MSDECAANDPVSDPWNWTWYQAYEWDLKNSNSNELVSGEEEVEAISRACDHADADDFAGALEIWRDLAERGSVWSMVEIARCYEYGRCVVRDVGEAEFWYQRAYAGGSQVAMLKCANFAASRNDFSACARILQWGVDQNWAPAQFWLAWYRRKQSDSKATYRTILPLLQKAAQRGHPAAQICLANFMMRGKFGWWRIPAGFFRVVRLAIGYANRKSPPSDEAPEVAIA